MPALSESLIELDTLTKQINWCWSCGATRLGRYDCRAFPREQGDRPVKTVIIETADTLREAVVKCLRELEREMGTDADNPSGT